MAKGGAKEAMFYHLGTRRVLTDGTPSEKQFMDVILVNGRAHQGGKREAAHE